MSEPVNEIPAAILARLRTSVGKLDDDPTKAALLSAAQTQDELLQDGLSGIADYRETIARYEALIAEAQARADAAMTARDKILAFYADSFPDGLVKAGAIKP